MSSKLNQYFAKGRFRLPFNGEWFVCAAGDTINVNHHMTVQSQWFGMDFAKSLDRSLSVPLPKKMEDYYSWSNDILSPIDGAVVNVQCEIDDLKIGKKNTKFPFGNFLIIKSADNEFVVLAHLQRKSILVKVHDRVNAGQLVGKCGNSGNSDFPHLHMHVQTGSNINSGQGLIVTFSDINVVISGHEFKNVTWPLISGIFVEQNYANDA
jgi:hypothetical protein